MLLPFALAIAAALHISVVDFYGVQHVSRAALERALQVHPGDAPPDLKAAERRLAAVPGVRAAHVGGICCWEGGYILWVGIEESGSPRLVFRATPSGSATLPADVDADVEAFYAALEKAVRSGDTAEDLSHPYSLVANPAARAIQQRFCIYAKRDLPILRTVLHTSRSDRERAHAAQVIAYAADPRKVVPDLVDATDDPSDEVRNAAVRALGVMAFYAQKNPNARIRIPARPFVKLLSSPVWTDRNKALMVLADVTFNRDPATLEYLRKAAFPALIEAAHWKLIGYAGPALYILGRIGGVPEATIIKSIADGDRDRLIAAARRTTR